MLKSPVILIPQSNVPINYLKALKSVGLEYENKFSPKHLEKYSGLLLTGGGDILSSFYNCKINCNDVNVLRDVNEFRILDYFVHKNAPILGVCRGMQLINVYLGGTLKNVCGHNSPTGKDVFHKTHTNDMFFKHLHAVNSNHKQCVDKLCPLANNVTTSNDNVVEGFTYKNIIAVQFHPERMSKNAISLIYGAFANLTNVYFKSL